MARGSRNFQGNNKKPAIGRKVLRRTSEHEALIYSHGYFSRGNEKTGATLKDFKEHLYCYVIVIKSTLYVYRTTFSRSSYFLGGGWGRLYNIFSLGRGTYSKGSAFLKLGANSSIYRTCELKTS